MGQANSRSELLWQMSGFGNKLKVKEILAEGIADPNWVSLDDASTAIMVAAGSKKGDCELIKMLVAAGADVTKVDNRDNTALHHAAMRGDPEVIKALVEAGANLDAQNRQAWTPLMNACYWCKPDAAAALIDLGANVDLLNKEKRSALHELCRSPLELYSCKIDEEEEEEEQSPTEGVKKTMEDLIEERRSREEKEAARLERMKSRSDEDKAQHEEELAEVACLLLDAGCDPDLISQSYGEEDFTPLLYAAYHNHTEVALVLTQCDKKKVDVNYQGGNDLWTALHWAADKGNVEMVQLLVDAGADPFVQSFRGELPFDRAGNEGIKTILLNAQNVADQYASPTTPTRFIVPPQPDTETEDPTSILNNLISTSTTDSPHAVLTTSFTSPFPSAQNPFPANSHSVTSDDSHERESDKILLDMKPLTEVLPKLPNE